MLAIFMSIKKDLLLLILQRGLGATSATDQNASTLFGDDYDVNYPKNIVIPSDITLGTNNTSEYALEIDGEVLEQ